MKKYSIYLLLLLLGFTSCNDSFLERLPETSLVTEKFFNSPADLQLFVNKLYLSENANFWDIGSDNVMASERCEVLDLLRGNITPATAGGWNWAQIRELNYFLDNAGRAKGDQNLINHYIGIVRMLRAREYYNLVKRYNDVPWYEHVLSDTDTEELYKTQDPRTFVVQKIMEDLNYACAHVLPQTGNRTEYNKWYAYGIKARIALHEGTFRKYHDELGLQDTADEFLKIAAATCDTILNEGGYSLYTTGGPEKAYGALFNSEDLSNCSEMIMFRDYNYAMNVKHPASNFVFNYTTNLSRQLMENYLVLQGGKAVPFSSLKDYQKKTFKETFENRDPRYAQTFMYPGFIKPGDSKPFIPNMNLGGYPQIKYVTTEAAQMLPGNCAIDLPLMRLAEVMLMYAEAKAELGTLTQGDLDRTINLLRDRAGMPHMTLAELSTAPVDPMLAEQYPNVQGAMKNAILEIRRERRVELACEGFRVDDIMRWKVGKLLESNLGVFVENVGVPFDVTGDGDGRSAYDVGIFLDNKSVKPFYKKKICYYLYEGEGKNRKQTSISLVDFVGDSLVVNGDHGYITLTTNVNSPKKFIEPKYYYFPVPQGERVINKNLKETIFWGEDSKEEAK